MHVKQIIDALGTLDVEEDDHWTEDGAPRLDVLNDLLPAVTRQQIVKAAPRFTRKNPILPDLEAEKAEADEALAVEQDLKFKVKQAEVTARKAEQKVAGHNALIRDQHTLTRQNKAWIESQNAEILSRHKRQAEIDKQLNMAGGTNQVGLHPIDRNEAARVKARRRQAGMLPIPKKA